MPKRLEDVLNQRRLKRNVMFSLSRYRDDVCETKRLVQILAFAITSVECPEELHVNAVLCDLILSRLDDIDLGLRGTQKRLM